MPKTEPTPPPIPSAGPGGVPQAQPGSANIPPAGAPAHYLPKQAHLSWALGTPLAMHVHLSTSPTGDVFSKQWAGAWREDRDAALPSFVWDNITFGDWADSRTVDFLVDLPKVRKLIFTMWAA